MPLICLFIMLVNISLILCVEKEYFLLLHIYLKFSNASSGIWKKFLNIIYHFSFKFEYFLVNALPKEPSAIINSEPYKRFNVDLVPVIKPESLPISLEDAFELYKSKHNGHEPKPINRRTKPTFPKSTRCRHCEASHEYIFDNRSGKVSIQLRCKICNTTFSLGKSYSQEIAHYCPYCGNKLVAIKERSNFTVYKCLDKKCSLYMSNYKKLSKE